MTTLSFWKIHSTFLPVHLRIVNGMSFLGAVFVKQGHLEVLLLCSGINAGILKETVSPPIFTIRGNES